MRTLRAKILSPDRRRRSDGVTSQWPSAGSRRAARRSPAGKSRRPDTTHAPKIIGPAGSSNAISCVIGDARHIGWEGLDASILREQAAVNVPGSAFGAQGEGYLRLTRSEEHTSELQSLMRLSYAVFCSKKKKT